jgi:probable rRNA maturation factor
MPKGSQGCRWHQQRILSLHNRQRIRRVNLRLLRRIVRTLLRETCPHVPFDLAVHVVAEAEMTQLNETYLRHKGSTDVITFDYAENVGQASRLSPPRGKAGVAEDMQEACPALLHGEIFVCINEALSQARRFHTIWQSELVRYAVHGVLHLLGYDDADSRARQRMKAAEDTLVSQLARRFHFRALEAILRPLARR